MCVMTREQELYIAPSLPPHSLEILIPTERIQHRVSELAAQITHDYSDWNMPLLLVGVLNGAAIFLGDLVRAIQRPLEFDFVGYSSYDAAMISSGNVVTLKDLRASVTGKDVVVVEDILDTGLTLHKSGLLGRLYAEGASSVAVCVLLDKPSRRQVPIPIQYKGFEIEDHFVVGYGMDYAEQYRQMADIAYVVSAVVG